jgi:hypothetical protein
LWQRRLVAAVAAACCGGGGGLLRQWRWLVAAVAAACWGGGVHVGCCCGGAATIVVVVAAVAADCWGAAALRRRPIVAVQVYKTINPCWSAIMFTGVIVMKGEFIIVSYRLILYVFSKDLLITIGECLSVAAVVAAAVAMLVAVVVAWRSFGRRVVVVGCWCCGGGIGCGLILRQWLRLRLVTAAMACYCGNGLLRWQ